MSHDFPYNYSPIRNRPILGWSSVAITLAGLVLGGYGLAEGNVKFDMAGILTVIGGGIGILLSGTRPNKYYNTAFD